MKKLNLFYLFISLGFLMASCGDVADDTKYREFPSDLFDDSYVHEVRFSFYAEKGWDSLYAYKKTRDSLEVTQYLPVRMVLDSFLIDSVGLRFKGESSFLYTKNNKKSFKLSVNKFNHTKKYGEIKNLNFNNCFKDPTFIREKIQLDFLRAQKLHGPRSSFIRVYVNDEYLGIYLLAEEIDKKFLDHNFTNHDGNLYLGEPQAYLDDLGPDQKTYVRKYKKKQNNASEDRSDLVDLITRANTEFKKSRDRKYAENLDELLNTQSMLQHWAVNSLFVNPDAFNMLYRHNYALYHEPTSGKFQWFTWDYNLGFAAWNPKYRMEQVFYLPVDHCEDFGDKESFQERILNNKIYRKQYLNILSELVKEQFSIDNLGNRVDKWASLIRKDVYADSLKMYSNEDFEKNLTEHIGDPTDPGAFTPGLKAFIIKRRDYIIKELKKEGVFQ